MILSIFKSNGEEGNADHWKTREADFSSWSGEFHRELLIHGFALVSPLGWTLGLALLPQHLHQLREGFLLTLPWISITTRMGWGWSGQQSKYHSRSAHMMRQKDQAPGQDRHGNGLTGVRCDEDLPLSSDPRHVSRPERSSSVKSNFTVKPLSEIQHMLFRLQWEVFIL